MGAKSIRDILKLGLKPDNERLLKALKANGAAALYEFGINKTIVDMATYMEDIPDGPLYNERKAAAAYRNLGYDYANLRFRELYLPSGHKKNPAAKTVSLNNGIVHDWESFHAYPWPKLSDADFSVMDTLNKILPDNMRLILNMPGGVLENTVSVLGYENLCMLLYDEPELVSAVFEKVGSFLYEYCRTCVPHPVVCAAVLNDDWGFNTQTMISPAKLRKHVFPWHKKIVSLIHNEGKAAILHSCGNLRAVMDDIIDDMRFDGKHSFEDGIIPVEEFYKEYRGRIAVVGGVDINFLAGSDPESVYARASAMLDLAGEHGGYLLGSGNSIPDYIPPENFCAMVSAQLDRR